jgi:hypothetical protein
MKVVVLVKAAPVLTRQLEETMCVAGVRVDTGDPAWVRLHPVPFRDLDDESKFAKYQTIEVAVRRPRSDRRAESWCPLAGTIVVGETIGSERGWVRRRLLIDQLRNRTMCELIDLNRSGSGPGTPSLAVVRPRRPPHLRITTRDEDQLREWRRRADAVESRQSLFDVGSASKPPFEVVPWRFQYDFQCEASACPGHTQTIVDWEVLALWRRVRHLQDWPDQMRKKFEETLWQGRESMLFVGNQEQYPVSFLVLGIFWPPVGPVQEAFDF